MVSVKACGDHDILALEGQPLRGVAVKNWTWRFRSSTEFLSYYKHTAVETNYGDASGFTLQQVFKLTGLCGESLIINQGISD